MDALESGRSAFAAGPTMAAVGRDGVVGLVTMQQADGPSRADVVELYDGYGVRHAAPRRQAYRSAVHRLFARLGVSGVLAFEPQSCPAVLLETLPPLTIDITERLRRARMLKSAAEIAALRRCAEIAAAGQHAVLHALSSELTELDVFASIRAAMEREAGARIAIAGDLVSGRERTALIGGWPNARRISTGDAVIVDLAPQVDGYWGDSCATVVLGEASAAQAGLFRAAQAGLEHAQELLRPGITAGALHRAVRTRVQAEGGDYPHHTGHSIGTAVHEHPRLCDAETTVLQPDMVLMVEPGAYDPAIGGVRLEWMLQVTRDGCEALSPFPHVLSI